MDARHVLKNSLIPVVTVISLSLPGLLSTGIITERILGIPGMGNLAIDAIFNRDYPVIMAIKLIARDGVRAREPGGRHRVHADRPQDSLQLAESRRAAFGRMGTDWQRVN